MRKENRLDEAARSFMFGLLMIAVISLIAAGFTGFFGLEFADEKTMVSPSAGVDIDETRNGVDISVVNLYNSDKVVVLLNGEVENELTRVGDMVSVDLGEGDTLVVSAVSGDDSQLLHQISG